MAKRYIPKFYPTVDSLKNNFLSQQINIININHKDEIVYRVQCYLGVSNDVAQKMVESYFEVLTELLFNNNKIKLSLGYLIPQKIKNKINIIYKPININNYD